MAEFIKIREHIVNISQVSSAEIVGRTRIVGPTSYNVQCLLLRMIDGRVLEVGQEDVARVINVLCETA